MAWCQVSAIVGEDGDVVLHDNFTSGDGLPVIGVLLAKVLRRMRCPVAGLEPGIGTVFRKLPPSGVSHAVGWRFAELSSGGVSA